MNTAEALCVYVTAPDQNTAAQIARVCVEERLAACANIASPHQSLYWWRGQIESSMEVAVIFKTVSARFEALKNRIKSLHPYETCCIVAWPIVKGERTFLDWLAGECR